MRCSTALTAGCSLVAFALAAQAQTVVDSACTTRLVDGYRPAGDYWTARTQVATTAALTMLERDGKWEAAVRHIDSLFREDAQFFPASDAAARAQYDRVASAIAAFRTSIVATLESQSPTVEGAELFRVRQIGNSDDYQLMNGAVRFAPTSDSNRARSFCAVGHAVSRLHERFTLPTRLQSERDLHARVKRWDSFNEDGLMPYPWELLANELVGWLGRKPLEPPTRQLVVARPSPALDIGKSFNSRVDVLVVEALGIAWYYKAGTYVAVSGTWISPSGAKPGYGALVRISQLPFVGGPVWRDSDSDGKRDLRWVLSLDAYDLLKTSSGNLVALARRATNGRAGQ